MYLRNEILTRCHAFELLLSNCIVYDNWIKGLERNANGTQP